MKELTKLENLRYITGQPIVNFDFAKQYLALQNILQNLEKQTCRLECSTKEVFLRKARDNTKSLHRCKSNEDIFEWCVRTASPWKRPKIKKRKPKEHLQ